MEDWRLLERYRADKSESAFADLVARHMGMVNGVCRRELDDPVTADDATVVVFTLLAKKADRLRRTGSLASWLFQTARFVARDMRKRENRRKQREVALDECTEGAGMNGDPEWNEIEPILNDAIDALANDDRQVILLRYFEQRDFAEISQNLGISSDAARARSSRAVDKLRRWFARRGVATASVALAAILTERAAASASALNAISVAGTAHSLVGGVAPVAAAKLALSVQGVLRSMWLLKLKTAAAVVAGAAVVVTVAPYANHGILQRAVAHIVAHATAHAATKPPTHAAVATKAPAKPNAIVGTVFDPLGRPAAGVKVIIDNVQGDSKDVDLITDTHGHYTVPIPPDAHPNRPWASVYAFKAGVGLGGEQLTASARPIQLQPVTGFIRGTVTDPAGRPQPGITVRLGYILVGRAFIKTTTPSLRPYFCAKTDAGGAWSIHAFVTNARVSAFIDDPRFSNAPMYDQTGSTPILLVATAGGGIAGRLLSAGGRPVRGVRIFARGEGTLATSSADASTNAQGEYHMTGLAPGPYDVVAMESGGHWVASPDQGVVVPVGSQVQAPDMREISGGVVRGVVLDAVSGNPVGNVEIGSYGSGFVEGTTTVFTDRRGRYHLRLAPGKASVYIMDAGESYTRPDQGVNVNVSLGQTVPVNFSLQPGASLSGTMSDTAGHRVSNEFVSLIAFGARPGMENGARTDAAGRFKAQGLSPGKYYISVGPQWSLVSANVVGVPASAPERVLVRRNRMMDLTGRVTDPAGHAIADAQVTATISTPMPGTLGTGTDQTTATDANGAYVFHDIGPTQTVTIAVSLPGYRMLSGGDVTYPNPLHEGKGVSVNGNKLVATDLLLASLTDTSFVNGTVVDAQGDPVTGATVEALDSTSPPTLTDSAGRFTIPVLAVGSKSVAAAKGNQAGVFTYAQPLPDGTGTTSPALSGPAPGELRIVLTPMDAGPGSDIDAGEKILLDIYQESSGAAEANVSSTTMSEDKRTAASPHSGAEYYDRDGIPYEVAARDPDAGLKFIEATQGTANDAAVGVVVDALSQADPGRALTWGLAKLDGIRDPSAKRHLAITLAMLAAPSDKPLALKLYKEALNGYTLGEPYGGMYAADPVLNSTYGLTQYAAVAGRLGLPQADAYTNQAVKTVLGATAGKPAVSGGGSPTDGYLIFVAGAVAKGNAELAERVIPLIGQANWARDNGLNQAVRACVDADPAGAEKLANQISADFIGGGAERCVAVAIASTDPARGLKIARSITDPENRALALAQVAGYLDKDAALRGITPVRGGHEAAKIFREAFAVAAVGTRKQAFVAHLAWLKDPALGEELLGKLASTLASQSSDSDPTPWGSCDLAFYEAPIDPAASRLLLERVCVAASRQTNHDKRSLLYPCVAMAAVDVNRALEIAKAIPDANARFDAERKIAQWVMAPQAVRRTIRFDRWTASDNWVPGSPTEW